VKITINLEREQVAEAVTEWLNRTVFSELVRLETMTTHRNGGVTCTVSDDPDPEGMTVTELNGGDTVNLKSPTFGDPGDPDRT
jgi:hypothetical protein